MFYMFDERGNTVERLRTTGGIDNHGSDDFGLQYSYPASTDPFGGFGAQWGYYLDTETGFYLLGQRYYDPALARFINEDPIGAEGGINVYGYVGNCPFANVDPSGLLHIVITIGSNGLGVAKVFADRGDVIASDRTTDRVVRSLKGGELLAQTNVSNITSNMDADPSRLGAGGPFRDGTYPIIKIGHGRKMGPNWFKLGGFAGRRGTWWHSGHGEQWWRRTGGCVRGAESAVNDAVAWFLLDRAYNPGADHRLTVTHVDKVLVEGHL